MSGYTLGFLKQQYYQNIFAVLRRRHYRTFLKKIKSVRLGLRCVTQLTCPWKWQTVPLVKTAFYIIVNTYTSYNS